MDILAAISGGFLSSAATTLTLYPYRDYVKQFDWRTSTPPDPNYALSRYRGLAQNPGIVAIISAPFTVMMAIYNLLRPAFGITFAALFGGAVHGAAKRAVKVYSNRMMEQSHRGPVYATARDAISVGTARKGAWAWLQGYSAVLIPHVIWYSVPLWSLATRREMHRKRPEHRPGFGKDVWDAWRIHSFCGLLSAPFRNSFRSVIHRTDYNTLKTASEWVANEKAVWQEAYVVASRMLREAGPAYFFHGTIKSSFMTSLPWALTFAIYRAMHAPF